ncbi:ovochymase-1, partial [Caerostris extrusa]
LCKDDERICRNRNCYHQDKICDDVDDCGDGTDEENVGKVAAQLSERECGKTPIKPDNHPWGSWTVGSAEGRFVPNSWPWQVSIQRSHIEPNGHFVGRTSSVHSGLSAPTVLASPKDLLSPSSEVDGLTNCLMRRWPTQMILGHI